MTTYDFTGRCGLEHGGVGHWNVDVMFRLRHDKAKRRWWYEADCAPGVRQPIERVHGKYRVMLGHLNAWPETAAVLAEYGVSLPMAVSV